MGTVRVSGLGKAYKRYRRRWSRLAEWLLPGNRIFHEPHWVLRGLDFSVNPGEAVGVIGVNGAGKSTLLKIITGTTEPTEGRVEVTGRVAALLELGMGFHPDFSGRQNAVMAGQLLGYSARAMAELLPEIEAFAEIGEYIDQPVRLYSSGMQMRLGFAVATARRPDVLIVDEALSVGDARFQHKCVDRIRAFRREGTTLLLVSHDKAAIQAICDRAILLDGGRIAIEGKPEAVMDYYNALLAGRDNNAVRQELLADGSIRTCSGTGEAVVEGARLLDTEGRAVEVIAVGDAVALEVSVRVCRPIAELVVGYAIKDRLGQQVFGTNTHHLTQIARDVRVDERLTYRFRFGAALGPGTYAISVALHAADSHIGSNYEWQDLAVVFTVINRDKPFFVGSAWLPPSVECER
jgi:lipopolysaccharide transport system ATP-binding protein